nr:hypothetical protein Iba_scaffold33694CG0130 [Ipomoea batatas]GMD11298.1 hypothetical protein Iba_scaffold1026090CG0010 [Ipomoea batatas]GME00837.1 hypothetical protein Iba_scaffold56034CG0010 [Ipomoea batatas]GME16631.1 hypothetical protein Iba_scaffold17804CG0140 [Ipomoea batatas]
MPGRSEGGTEIFGSFGLGFFERGLLQPIRKRKIQTNCADIFLQTSSTVAEERAYPFLFLFTVSVKFFQSFYFLFHDDDIQKKYLPIYLPFYPNGIRVTLEVS